MTVRSDNRLAEIPMRPVQCRRCTADVLVRKSSWNQTSVQWDRASMAVCAERADGQHLGANGDRPLFITCSALQEAIGDAVCHGQIPVGGESVESDPPGR